MSDTPGARKVTYRKPTSEPDKKRRPRTPVDEEVETEGGEASHSKRRSSESSMPLLAVCEPLFQQICLYNHAMQNGATLSYPQVRREMEQLLGRIKADAHHRSATAGLYDERLEQSLLFFVDNFFADCGQQPIAGDWAQNRLAFALNPPNYVGDEMFFTHLDETLQEKSEGVKQKLAVYFTCIGLGMTGIYASQPQVLRRKQLDLAQRLRSLLESKDKKRICQEAYESINHENLIEPPIKPPLLIAIGMIGMLLVLILVYLVAYTTSTSELHRHLDSIQQSLHQQATDNASR